MAFAPLKTAFFLVTFIATACSAQWTCPDGYILDNEWCYYFDGSTTLTFDDAVTFCRSRNGDLASIHDDATNNFISKFGGVIIGLRYAPERESYNWTDGTAVDYTSYDDNFVQWRDFFGYCAKQQDGKWLNLECATDKIKFVCRARALPSATVSQPTKSVCPDRSTMYTTPGVITSPDYPGQYNFGQDEEDCRYKLAAKNDLKIQLTFDEVNMTEGLIFVYKKWSDVYEYVQVENYFTGKTLIVDSNLVLLRFVDSPAGRWKITWKTVTDDGTVTATNQCPDANLVYVAPVTIRSAGYPDTANANCTYLVATKYDKNIRVNFKNLNIRGSNYIFIYTKWNISHGSQLYFNKGSKGAHVTVESNQLLLLVDTQLNVFDIDFSAVEV